MWSAPFFSAGYGRKGTVHSRNSWRRYWKGNLSRAFKRVKANKGAPGIDGITVEEIGAYLRENQKELIERIKRGKYTPAR